MRIEQLECLREIARRGLNVSAAADALGLSQPAVSRQLRAFERELGVDVFTRNRRRLTGVTAPGRAILAGAGRMLAEAENLVKIGRDFVAGDSGSLTVATTHTQARYALPQVIRQFRARHPGIHVGVRQGNPEEITALVRAGTADLCIGSAPAVMPPELVSLPCAALQRVVLAPRGHALARARRLTLAAIARHPIITYDDTFSGRTKVERAFAAAGLKPDFVLSAADTDVIKTFVESGLGIAIVADMAHDPRRDKGLVALSAAHLFESNTISVSLRRGDFLRAFVYTFIEMIEPRLTRGVVERAVARPLSRVTAR